MIRCVSKALSPRLQVVRPVALWRSLSKISLTELAPQN